MPFYKTSGRLPERDGMYQSEAGAAVAAAFVEHARVFATAAHAAVGQKRKYTGEDYIHHPAAVVDLLLKYVPEVTTEQLAAAWLHDTVEDCAIPLALITQEFGAVVGDLVGQLSDVSRPGDGNRAARKAIDLAHTASACAQAKTVKLADLIDNSKSILEHDTKFARVYLAEKRMLLAVLSEGNPALRSLTPPP